MKFHDSVETLRRKDRFLATVSAINGLLQAKGVYTSKEFEDAFMQWSEAFKKKKRKRVKVESGCV